MAKERTVAAALALDGLGGDARDAFGVAAGAGYRGVSFATNHRELNPDLLGESARRHVRSLLASQGLGIAVVRAAVPRGGLADPATIDRTIENARKAMLLAREMNVGTVAVYIGSLLAGKGSDAVPHGSIVTALRELAQQADAAGLTLAVGAEGSEALAGLLKQVDFDGARANLDSGRVLTAGEDMLKVAEEMAGRLGQVTAADVIVGGGGRTVRAAKLGEGQLDVASLMGMLEEQGFRGPLVVDVRDLPDGVDGAEHAARVLRQLQR